MCTSTTTGKTGPCGLTLMRRWIQHEDGRQQLVVLYSRCLEDGGQELSLVLTTWATHEKRASPRQPLTSGLALRHPLISRQTTTASSQSQLQVDDGSVDAHRDGSGLSASTL
jgi:hypothetical protein